MICLRPIKKFERLDNFNEVSVDKICELMAIRLIPFGLILKFIELLIAILITFLV